MTDTSRLTTGTARPAPATEPVPFITADLEPQGYTIPSPQAVADLEARVLADYAAGGLRYDPEHGDWYRDGAPVDDVTGFTIERLNLAGRLREQPAEPTAAEPAPKPTLAQRQAAGLRVLADMIEANPELADNFSHTLGYSGINVMARAADVAAEMAQVGRIARQFGATTTKSVSDKMFNLVMDFGGVKAEFLAYREEVCERVVTGTREITEEVPDPAALAKVPTTTVTRVVEDVEWVCRPLLASDQNAPVSA